MKNYKTIIIAFMLLISFFVTTASAETKIQATDELDDVITDMESEQGNVSYPDADIKKITVDVNNNKVNLILELNEDGEIYTSGFFAYSIELQTSSNLYTASYGLGDENGTTTTAAVNLNEDFEDDVLDDYSVESNKLTFTFDLVDSNEVCIGINGYSMLVQLPESLYMDYVNGMDDTGLTISSGDSYYTKTGETFTLEGKVTEGDASDYNWIWTFEDSATTLTGQTVTHTFYKNGNFSGTLYVYNPDNGKYVKSFFNVQVNGTSITPDKPDNNQPGFEIIAFISAVAIALIVLRKRRKK